ncbi:MULTISPECIES: protein-disulfide reductase DsbD domain-containing protein [unclassified Yoonia]|uniref:protein-disulfide reductase DsbD domain-containing protein n=1 Tax=unclassified Yoonia TaxID=2629118 RepID=UPI002AFEA301|nr:MULTISPECIES: protein-disulfide reductase DsbD domain-containing protein [unclassified Yoonia]
MRKSLLIPLALCGLPATGFGQSVEDLATVTVLPGWRDADGTHVTALRIDLAEGWKTYWRAPGDSGIPPSFSFTGTDITAVQPHFPVPEVYEDFGIRSIGYENSVVFPLRLTLPEDGSVVSMAGQIEIGVCDEICIPVTLDFSALLPPGGSSDPAIVAALRDRPLTKAEAQVGTVTCTLEPISDGLQLTAQITMPRKAVQEVVVIEAGDPQVWVSEPSVSRVGTTLNAVVDMVHVSGQPFALDRSAVRITVLGDGQAVDIQGCVAG